MAIKEPLIIMGNGPSINEVDFSLLENKHTFGLCGAYKQYPILNWYPKYFGVFDITFVKNRAMDLYHFINSAPIEKIFLFSQPKICINEKIQYIKTTSSKNAYENIQLDNFFWVGGSSSHIAAKIGLYLSYKKIILIGVDCNYKSGIYEHNTFKGDYAKIKKEIKNDPNYWFKDYMTIGDEIISAEKLNNGHKSNWENFKHLAEQYKVEVVNCSSISTITSFRKSTLEKEI